MSRRPYRKYPYLEKHPEYGIYYAYYRDVHGARARTSLKTKDQVIASKRFTQLLEEADRGVLGFSRTPTRLSLREVARRYFADGIHDLSPATVERHERAFRLHVQPFFGRTNFKAISPKRVLAFVRKRQQAGAAPNTIMKELAVLSAVFNFAIEEEIVQFNPVRAIKKPRLKLVRPNYTPTGDQLERILSNLYPGARRFFLALCNTGCRVGELKKANIADVDLNRGVLRVIRKGDRLDFVPINAVLRAVIEEELGARDDPAQDEPLFLNSWKRRFKTIRKPLSSACDKAGVPHCTHHSLRHAYATMLHEAGSDIGTISKLLGHTNPTTTRNIYVHFREPGIREAAESVQIGKKLARPRNRGSVDGPKPA